MEEELKVKPGDELLCTTRHYSGTRKRIVTVTKVTPTGRIRILESDAQFDKYGKQMGIGTSRADMFDASAELSVPTQEDYKELQEAKVIATAISAMKRASKNLSYELAVKILKTLEVDS